MKRVAIFATMPAKGFSGGRYHALMAAYALSQSGHEVTVICDNIPEMWDEIVGKKSSKNVRFVKSERLEPEAHKWSTFDFVICVPDMSFSSVFYSSLRASIRSQCGLGLINFESPNWFNYHSPFRRKYIKWLPWWILSIAANWIISSTQVGNEYARRYYVFAKKRSFVTIPPSINDRVARVQLISEPPTRNYAGFRLFAPTRIRGGDHKGINDFQKILVGLQGPGIVSVLVDDPKDPRLSALRSKLSEKLISLELLTNISEKQKFLEYKKADLTVFPSYFEGFGYPPVESLCVGTQVIAFRIPVLSEVTLGGAFLTNVGDTNAFSIQILRFLENKNFYVEEELSRRLIERYSVNSLAARLTNLINDEGSVRNIRRGLSLILLFILFALRILKGNSRVRKLVNTLFS